MRKQYTLLVLLVLCIGGVGAIGSTLFEQSKSDCTEISADEKAISRSRLGFPDRDLMPLDDPPHCADATFTGSIAFHDRTLSPEDVVEMAAAAGWTTDNEDLSGTTCFRSTRPDWERIQLTMVNDGEPVRSLSVEFNADLACRSNPT